ncbi:hypothetical protein AQUCO_02800166v1 [Aquilegia coerulea]|uniref:Wax synthase domain-containing protein n=1 Tax=Aquilegia coerulea TaxID=218851 RepID=A0A2G5D451_AQUCA|nr:hypothetical protein AQUCO_02800166v1 [Aquilegia coerulea]
METLEGEIWNFIKLCIGVSASLTYCYFISSRLPKGIIRLLSILPIISIFIFLPLILSSVLLQFYFGATITWIANFKLILFAFGHDDTLSVNPSIPLLHFIILTPFPFTIKHKSNQYKKNKETSPSYSSTSFSNLDLTFLINTISWYTMIQIYVKYKEQVLFPNLIIIQFLYAARMHFGIQVHFALFAVMAKAVLGEELEPHFNKPHLSTSLGNFWGKRWNLMISNLLKSTVQDPIRYFFTPILGRRLAIHPAILATYIVSGLMHEMAYFNVGRQWPSWEVTWFFIMHGVCLSIEIEMKRIAFKNGWKLHPMISTPLTVGFVIITAVWMCYSELIHCGADVREIEEYAVVIDRLKYLSGIAREVTMSSS